MNARMRMSLSSLSVCTSVSSSSRPISITSDASTARKVTKPRRPESMLTSPLNCPAPSTATSSSPAANRRTTSMRPAVTTKNCAILSPASRSTSPGSTRRACPCAARRAICGAVSVGNICSARGPSEIGIREIASVIESSGRRGTGAGGNLVTFVAETVRMGTAAVAGVTGHNLSAFGKDSGAGEIRVDAPQHFNHLAAGLFSGIGIDGESRGASMAKTAIHVERVAKILHDGAFAMHFRSGGQQFEVRRRIVWRDGTLGITAIEEVDGRFRFRFRLSAVASEAIDLMVTARKHAAGGGEKRFQLPHHGDHRARGFLAGVPVGGEVAGNVAIGALHSKSLVESAHGVDEVAVRRQNLKVRGRGHWWR